MKNYKHKFFFLAVLSFLINAFEYIDLSFEQLSKSINIKGGKFQYYKVRIDGEEYDEEKDLVIKVFARFQDDPNVYISKVNSKPSSKEDAEWICSQYGQDTCAISHSDISSGDIFNIGVTCPQDCKVEVLATYPSEIQLENGMEMQLDFLAKESKIFKFYIPKNDVTLDKNNRVTSLTITAIPFLATNDQILLTMTKSKKVAPSSNSYKGVPGWRKGQTLRITEQNTDNWCDDCEIRILVSVEQAGKYGIRSKLNVGTQQLYKDKLFDDVAFFGDDVCYAYFVQDSTKDLQVKVQMYSGLLSYTINPKKQPIDYEDSAFKFIGPGSSKKIITPKQRKEVQQDAGLYFICIFPHTTSTYSLLVSEVPTNQPYRVIDDGFDEIAELNGKNQTVFMYKVPPLDYENEDIKLYFRLTKISGNSPLMFAGFCDQVQNIGKCAEDITLDYAFNPRFGFEKAKQNGNDLDLVIDHDERVCSEKYSGNCYYTIVIFGQSTTGMTTQFQLSVTHSQENYILLKEGHLHTDYVDLGSYKFYSFTLFDSSNVKNVTFKLNTIHGDADFFISREHTKPTRSDFEKSSVKSNEIIDLIYFDDNNLQTTYYIAVYAFQYSTYNIIVKVDRGQPDVENTPLLIEGYPVRSSIHNEKNIDQYRIDVKQQQGYEKGIKIQTQNIEGKVQMYINYGERASTEKYIWTSTGNMIQILPNDKNFHKEGTYFLTIVPKPTFWQQFMDNYYTYLVSYATMDSFYYLNDKYQVQNSQKNQTTNYFRHFITNYYNNFTLSMTVFSGSPQLFVSLNPDNKQPNKTHHDFNTKYQAVVSGSKSKALYITSNSLQSLNPGCKSFAQDQVDPCALYASVYCEDECKYALQISQDNQMPKELAVGLPYHSIMKEETFNYYYLNVRENKTKIIYAALSSLEGNADLFVKFIDNPQKRLIENWEKPTKNDYAFKSVIAVGNDIIKIKQSDLQNCFDKYDKKQGTEKECTIVFGVYANKNENKGTEKTPKYKSEIDNYNTRYNLLVYTDFLQLMNQSPISSIVEEGEYQYFLFEANCDDCNIIIGLSTYGSGDPDLFINYGDAKLPTQENYDIVASTSRSEIAIINLQNNYFQRNQIKSMRGPYIIGVYGNKKSNFTISVTSEKNQMTFLTEGTSTKVVQEAFDTVYYSWYNLYDEKDFKINLNVKNGYADVLVGTFDENDETQNMISRMPKSKRDALWILEDVGSTTSIADKELLIVNNEYNYCSSCYYIIAVVTHHKLTEYTISLDILDADFKNSQLMKIGEEYQTTLRMGQSKLYKFIIDDSSSFSIVQTTKKGQVMTKLSFNEKGDDVIYTLKNTELYTLTKEDSAHKVEKMYYLNVFATQDSEFGIQIVQEQTVLQLSDGLPIRVKFNDEKDLNKHALFTLPDGEYTVHVQVKTNTKSFYPRLYIKYYEDIDKNINAIDYPPAGMGFFVSKNWDYKLGILNYHEKFPGIKGGKSGLAITLSDVSSGRKGQESGEVYLTVSTSSVIKMVPGLSYIGQLDHEASMIVYQVDESLLQNSTGALKIEFSQCIGDAEYKFIDNPSQPQVQSSKVTSFANYEEYGRNYDFIKLPQEQVYIMVKPKPIEKGHQGVQSKDETDFILKVEYNSRTSFKDTSYHPSKEGKIIYDFVEVDGKDKIKLQWGDLYYTDSNSKTLKADDVEYHIIVTKDERVRLDSVCAIRKEVAEKYITVNFVTNDNYYYINQPQDGSRYYLNVIAMMRRLNQEEPEIIPYDPVKISVPKKQGTLSKFALCKNFLKDLFNIVCYVIIAAIFIGVSCYFWKKTKTTERQIEYEMANVSYMSHGKKGEQSYSSLSGGRDGVEDYILKAMSK